MADMYVTRNQRFAEFQPRDTEQALGFMREVLEDFYERQDSRAVFLRAYYVMTTEVNAAIHRRGDFPEAIFFDPEWVDQLAGKFARLYFASLAHANGRTVPEPWKRAHDVALGPRSGVIQNLLLGINAHINYDLAYGIYENFRQYEDHRDHLLLSRRKFDHDQINNLLVRCMPKVQQALGRDFGGGMRLFSGLFGQLDEQLTLVGLKHYRDRVWWNALSFLATEDEQEKGLVRQRLSWEALKVADFISAQALPQGMVRGVDRLLRRRPFRPLELEGPGNIQASTRTALRMQLPF